MFSPAPFLSDLLAAQGLKARPLQHLVIVYPKDFSGVQVGYIKLTLLVLAKSRQPGKCWRSRCPFCACPGAIYIFRQPDSAGAVIAIKIIAANAGGRSTINVTAGDGTIVSVAQSFVRENGVL